MEKEKMLVTQALDKRDLLRKKISDSIDRFTAVSSARPGDAKVTTGASIQDFNDEAKSRLQSIRDMIDRYERIDAAILLSNATEMIEVGGRKMTRAAAINLRKSIIGVKLSSTDFQGMLIRKIKADLDMAKMEVAKSKTASDRQKEMMISNITSSEKKELTADALSGIEKYCNSLVSDLVDPVNAEDTLAKLVEDRDTIIAGLESAIKVSNATTYVEF